MMENFNLSLKANSKFSYVLSLSFILAVFLILNIINIAPAQAKIKVNEDIVSNDFSGVLKISTRKKAGSTSRVSLKLDRFSEEFLEKLEQGDVEAWLVDTGASDSATSSVSDDDSSDNAFNNEVTSVGTFITDANNNVISLNNVPLINLVEAAPYALSMGVLKKDKKGNFSLNYKTNNNVIPYDYLMITVEEDGNQAEYDPRPGNEVARINLDFQ